MPDESTSPQPTTNMTVDQAALACNNLLKYAEMISRVNSRFNAEYVFKRATEIRDTITAPNWSGDRVSYKQDWAIRKMWDNSKKWDRAKLAPAGGLFATDWDTPAPKRTRCAGNNSTLRIVDSTAVTLGNPNGASTHTVAVPSLTSIDIEAMAEDAAHALRAVLDKVKQKLDIKNIEKLEDLLVLTSSQRFKNLIEAAFNLGKLRGVLELQAILEQDLNVRME